MENKILVEKKQDPAFLYFIQNYKDNNPRNDEIEFDVVDFA